MSEPQRYPTRDELDYEARKAAGFPGLGVVGNDSKGVVSTLQTTFAVEGNDTSAYVGVTQDRMTYANETERPLQADGGTEADREDRLFSQEFLVAPAPEQPEVIQTAGGGSGTETITTALSGENLSAEIAKPVEEVAADQAPEQFSPAAGQETVGVPQGSSGQLLEEVTAEETTVAAAAASPAPDQLSEATGDPTAPVDEPSTAQGEGSTPASGELVPTPTTTTTRKKATSATSNAS